MNKYLAIIIFIVLVVLSFYLGRKHYKDTHEGFMRDNCGAIVFNMKNELLSIDHVLENSEDPTEEKLKQIKNILLKRREVLIKSLNMFYGKQYFN